MLGWFLVLVLSGNPNGYKQTTFVAEESMQKDECTAQAQYLATAFRERNPVLEGQSRNFDVLCVEMPILE